MNENDCQNPLFVNNKCKWPNCEMTRSNPEFEFQSFSKFLVHLNIEHGLDEKSHCSALEKIDEIASNERELFIKKRFLRFMLTHLNKLYRDQNEKSSTNSNQSDKSKTEMSKLNWDISTAENTMNKSRREDAVQFEIG
jgi:hypothetical protein